MTGKTIEEVTHSLVEDELHLWDGEETLDQSKGVLCVWPGTIVTQEAFDSGDIMDFFKEHFDMEPHLVGTVITLPNKEDRCKKKMCLDAACRPLYSLDLKSQEYRCRCGSKPKSGGRLDYFFYCPGESVPTFAVPRFRYRIRWWEDIYFNEGEDIYPLAFRQAFPDPNKKEEEE